MDSLITAKLVFLSR